MCGSMEHFTGVEVKGVDEVRGQILVILREEMAGGK